MKLRIRPPVHYDLLASVHAWIFPDIQPVPEVTGKGIFMRAVTIGDVSVPVVVRQKQPGSELRVEFFNEQVTTQEIRKKIQHIFGLDVDTRPALQIIKREPALTTLSGAIDGIHPYLMDTPFEALAKSIIQQQVSYRAANVFTKRFVLEIGRIHKTPVGNVYQFPSARDILNTEQSTLRQLGLGYKIQYIHTVAELTQSGELDLYGLIGQSYDEVHRILSPIRGIGEWTIKALSIAGLGNFSIFPYSDLGIRNLLGRLYRNGERMSASEVQNMSEEWGKAGPLVLYLLMCADVLGLFGQNGRRLVLSQVAKD